MRSGEEETCCRRCKKPGVHLRIDERFIPLCHECYDDPATHNLWGGCLAKGLTMTITTKNS